MPVLVTLTLTTAGWLALIAAPLGTPVACTVGGVWFRTVNGSLSAVPETVGAKSMARVQRPAAGLSDVQVGPEGVV